MIGDAPARLTCSSAEGPLMRFRRACAVVAVLVLLGIKPYTAASQLMSTCVENFPERRGEMGCSILETSCYRPASRSRCSGTSIASIHWSVRGPQLALQASPSRRPEPRGSRPLKQRHRVITAGDT
jgi:hypothetical protein